MVKSGTGPVDTQFFSRCKKTSWTAIHNSKERPISVLRIYVWNHSPILNHSFLLPSVILTVSFICFQGLFFVNKFLTLRWKRTCTYLIVTQQSYMFHTFRLTFIGLSDEIKDHRSSIWPSQLISFAFILIHKNAYTDLSFPVTICGFFMPWYTKGYVILDDQNNQKSCRLVLCWCRSVHCFFILTQKHNQRTTLRPYILTKEATAQVT